MRGGEKEEWGVRGGERRQSACINKMQPMSGYEREKGRVMRTEGSKRGKAGNESNLYFQL